MTLEDLRGQQTQLVLQRAQSKDVVENCERSLGQIQLAIQVLEAAKAEAEAEDNKKSEKSD
jgi:hypothetical protein